MRKRLTILAIAAVLPLTGAATLAAVSQAAADPASKTVVVKGSVDDCDNGSGARQVTITTTKESRTDKGTDVEDSGEYSITLKNVPSKSQKAKVTVTCEDKTTYQDSFTLKRPSGKTTTLPVDIAP
ncbi:hypothetical protein ABZT03_37960 [Streptomyces sp. NPDC005574]|uniref:hypothetical protein n=1 Tax=Streptomyces sp. NPDC005574 TaxID=3156891 RepID=UPI0033AFF72C